MLESVPGAHIRFKKGFQKGLALKAQKSGLAPSFDSICVILTDLENEPKLLDWLHTEAERTCQVGFARRQVWAQCSIQMDVVCKFALQANAKGRRVLSMEAYPKHTVFLTLQHPTVRYDCGMGKHVAIGCRASEPRHWRGKACVGFNLAPYQGLLCIPGFG